MGDFVHTLGLAAIPVIGNYVGGFLAEVIRPSRRILSMALHAAAGVVLAVVAVELLPNALASAAPWLVISAFVAGGLTFVGIDKAVDLVGNRASAESSEGSPWMIYASVLVDLFSDGLMVGVGTTLTVTLGLILALGQAPADLPEGFSTMSNLRRAGVSRQKRIILCVSFAIPLLAGASLGYFGLRNRDEAYKVAILAWTAGMLMTAAVEEIIPRAHEEEDSRVSTLALIGGFAAFAFVASYITA